MATRIESVRNLVGLQSITFIRPVSLSLKLISGRPTTKLNVFFDGVNVNDLCNTDLITDSIGELTTTLTIPGGRFTTGTKSVIVSDADEVYQATVNGSTFGRGVATFTSTGTLQSYQSTINTVDIVTIDDIRVLPPPPAEIIWGEPTIVFQDPQIRQVVDPLAQSFFTYGITGGMFISSVGLFFNSKDSTIPVRVDIREMVNGYPVGLGPTNADYISVVRAENVQISADASKETKFEFPVPIFLEEDKDYCFVVQSNSNKYNLFSSKMGELSIETGKTIYEQPYIGSLFKSENNITWTAEQSEDLKFTIYQAQFISNHTGSLTFNVTPNYWAIPGTSFNTVIDSSDVTLHMKVKHGLTIGSKVTIIGTSGAIYNGIDNSMFAGDRIVNNITDEYTFTFEAGAPASKTGQIITGGTITAIDIVTKGGNYTTATVVFSGGGGGVGAAATATISNGQIMHINITNIGTGYTTPPTVSIVGDGMGAIATAIIDAMFSVQCNMPITSLAPDIPVRMYDGNTISVTADLTNMSFNGSNIIPYTNGGSFTISHNKRVELPSYSVIASPANESYLMGGTPSLTINYTFNTENINVSPMIDMRNNPYMLAYSNNIRNQSGEDVLSQQSTGEVSQITLLNSGSGYITTPTISIVGSGSGASATAIMGTSAVSTISIVNGGTGYTTIPDVFIVGDGSGAVANAVLSPTSVGSVNMTNVGSGYISAPAVVFIGGGGGINAEAVAILSPTSIGSLTVSSGGSGYVTAPTVTFSGGGGSGATATASIVSGIVTSITVTDRGVGYTSIPTVTLSGGGGTGATATAVLSTRSISSIQVVNGGSGYTTAPSITLLGGNGTGATATAVLSTRSISSIQVVNGGSGYTTAPTVAVSGGGGSGATATASIVGKNIDSIVVTSPGQLYSSIPEVIINRTDQSVGVDAIAIASITAFNSEVSPTNGTNTSRYVTKLIKLETISRGINLFSEIYSENESSVDWYIRTSLSGSTISHVKLDWIPLTCDTTRNKSSNPDESFDYKFYKYDLPPFDTYDLKCVMRSNNPVKSPKVYNFRAIIVA